MKREWIAVDWGTTNFRAFLMKDSHCVNRIASSCGLLSVEKNAFAATLHHQLQPWLAAVGPAPVLMAGMVGSQQGWRNVPYVSLPADVKTLLDGIQSVETFWGSPAWITPGVSGLSAWGQPDVMRGEEVQLLGLGRLHPAPEHLVILPGTHSKHARLVDGRLVSFSTFMTGELFSVLGTHSLLGRHPGPQQDNDASFLAGVRAARSAAPFSHLIFAARTRYLCGDIAREHVHSFLSGILIGHELSTLAAGQQVWLVGSTTLSARYQLAATVTQTRLSAVNGDDCLLQGMTTLYSHLQEETP